VLWFIAVNVLLAAGIGATVFAVLRPRAAAVQKGTVGSWRRIA